MKYLFLITFGVFLLSMKAEAASSRCNSGYMDPRDYKAAGCDTQLSPAPRRTAKAVTTNRSKSRTTSTKKSPAQSGTCKPPANWRSICINGWNNNICECNPVSESSAENSDATTQDSGDNSAAALQCQADTIEAQNDCDQDQDTGIQSAQTTLSNFAVQMGSQMGIQAACSGIGKALAGANGAIVVFSEMCSSARSKCLASCGGVMKNSPVASERVQAEMNHRICRGLDAKIQQASQAIANMVGAMRGAQTCAKQTSTDLFNYCGSNPNAIGCENTVQDCSNPKVAATNPICICKANPSAATCTGINLKAGGGFEGANSLTADGASMGSGGGGNAGGVDGLIDNANWQGDPNLKPDQSASEAPGGSKGGRPLMEGEGGGGGSGGGNGGGGATTSSVAVNAGFRGGGGGGGWPGGGGNEGEYAGNPAGSPQAENTNPDLRQFLPGGKFDPKTRGLAGVSGPDGITGPHTDIWKKIQNRYQVQVEKSNLMP